MDRTTVRRFGGEEELSAVLKREFAGCDLVLVEGYKTYPMPKLEVWRATVGKPLLHPGDPNVRGLATDTPEAFAAARFPVFRLTDVDEIATFVLREAAVWPFAIDAHGSAE